MKLNQILRFAEYTLLADICWSSSQYSNHDLIFDQLVSAKTIGNFSLRKGK